MCAPAAQALRTAFWNYDRTQPLIDGTVRVEGSDLAIEVHRPETISERAFGCAEFDVCEISFSNSVTAVSKGEFAYLLVPVFLARVFRHSSIIIRTDRGISQPKDLKGKTVGLQEYGMTAAVVMRGFLRDYGVAPQDITLSRRRKRAVKAAGVSSRRSAGRRRDREAVAGREL